MPADRDNSRSGAVASGHPLVTDAAVEVLAAGGNAFDAAIAAGFASATAEPCLTSLGGGGFLLARTAAGREVLFDFFVDTPGRGLPTRALEPHFFPITVHFPGSEQDFNTGLGSAAVPGNLKGYLHVHRRLGRLPLEDILRPAIRLAREGAVLNPHQACFVRLLDPILTLTEAGRALYAPSGAVLGEGERLVNRDLAGFLETLPADGARDFYEGDLARRVADEMRAGNGLVTAADLSAYAVEEREPLVVEYLGHRLLTNPPPAFGGSLVGLSLALLAQQDLAEVRWGSERHLTTLAAVMEEIDRLREDGCVPPSALTGDALAAAAHRVRTSTRGTTHVSVVDGDGNLASMTTSNGEGSGYIVPGTGIMLNNMMGEDDLHPQGFHGSPAGERVASMMSPTAVLDSGGGVVLVVGSGGSKRIRTALLQVISSVVGFGLTVRQAVEAPRLHWDGELLQVEPGFPENAIAALERRWRVNVWPVRDLYFGGAHAVAPGGDPGEGCAGDPRRGGAARRAR